MKFCFKFGKTTAETLLSFKSSLKIRCPGLDAMSFMCAHKCKFSICRFVNGVHNEFHLLYIKLDSTTVELNLCVKYVYNIY